MKTANEAGRGGLRGLRDRYPRLALLPAGVLMGLVGAVGYLRNEEAAMAIFALGLMTLFGAVAAFSKSEYFVAGQPDGDERQRMISLEASKFGFHAMTLVAVVGFLWEDVYHHVSGEPPGVFTLMCVVSASSYAAAFVLLKRRR